MPTEVESAKSGTKFALRITRRLTRFVLATFLWLHGLFLSSAHAKVLAAISHVLHLSVTEATLFLLLFLFTVLFSAGRLDSTKNALYIYFFPLILLWYLVALIFLAIKEINALFTSDQPADGPTLFELVVVPAQPPAPTPAVTPVAIQSPTTVRKPAAFARITRPFRRFAVLWCILLLLSTHTVAIWLSFVAVLLVLMARIFTLVKLTVFSPSFFEKWGGVSISQFNRMMATLAVVTPETTLTKELKDLWQQLGFWTKTARLLRNKQLLSRWANLLVFTFYVGLYVYMAILFSFVYYGIGKVSGHFLLWPDALVDALFIPVYASALPKTLAFKFAGGLQCALVVTSGIGTFLNYLHKRLDAVQEGAQDICEQLDDEAVRTRYKLLESKVKVPSKK